MAHVVNASLPGVPPAEALHLVRRCSLAGSINLCECGCGEQVRGRFVTGHNRRLPLTHYREEDRGYGTPCYIWQGHITQRGYGWVTRNRRGMYTHRWAYEQVHGPVPAGHHVHHRCKVLACMNPAHLEALPKRAHWRHHNATRLNPDRVREARRRRAAGAGVNALAREYKVDPGYMSRVLRGVDKAWKDVE